MGGERILVTGARGLVGLKFKETYPNKDQLLTPTSTELDVTLVENLDVFFDNRKPTVVVNFSANTDVEGAEKDNRETIKVNVDGVKNIAELAKNKNIHVVHISTDFVFSGSKENPGPYKTTDKRESSESTLVGEYARSKILAEEVLERVGGKYTIVRISYPFGNEKSEKDFAIKTLKIIRQGYQLFTDQKFSPTYIPDLISAIEKIITNELTGIYHVVCSPVTTPFEFATYLSDRVGSKLEINEGNLEIFMKSKAKKPLVGGLIPSEELITRKWKEAVDKFSEKINL